MQSTSTIQVNPQLTQLQPTEHQVTHIVEVKFREQSACQETTPLVLFLAVFGCACCHLRQEWLSKERLVYHFGVNETKIDEIQSSAEKERKERETKRNAQAIQQFLNFSDVTDATDLSQFKLVHFNKNSPSAQIAQRDHVMQSSDDESEGESEGEEEGSFAVDSENEEEEEASSDDDQGCQNVVFQVVRHDNQISLNSEQQQPQSLQVEIDATDSLFVNHSSNHLQKRSNVDSPACCSSQDHKDCVQFRSQHSKLLKSTADVLCQMLSMATPCGEIESEDALQANQSYSSHSVQLRKRLRVPTNGQEDADDAPETSLKRQKRDVCQLTQSSQSEAIALQQQPSGKEETCKK